MKAEKNYAVILAAGKGKRFGGLKQFCLIKNIPLFLYPTFVFHKSPLCDEILIVTNSHKQKEVKSWVERFDLNKVKMVIKGGKERFNSVDNALRKLPALGYVAIHDGCRPHITVDMVNQGYRLVRNFKTVIFGIKSEDTLKEVRGKKVIKTLARERIFRVQTPQFFELSLLKNAYRLAKKKKWAATDDAGFVEKAGFPVYLFPGNATNIKLTTKQDLKIIKSFYE